MNRSILSVLCSCALVISLSLMAGSAVAEEGSFEKEEVPEGYMQDEYGRITQVTFDLRRRFHVGVSSMTRFDAEDSYSMANSLALETGGSNDFLDLEYGHRHRHRFLEGRLILNPLEVDMLFYSYDFSRSTPGSPIWITTFIGEPRRFDVPIEVGVGATLGRLHYRATEAGDLMLFDLLSGRVNWEFYQGKNLENYVLLSTGGGFGLRHLDSSGTTEAYAFPEVGLRAVWSLGERGLTQIALDGRMKWAWELSTQESWMMGQAGLSAEQILIAINDQPLSLYVEPHARLTQFEPADLDGVDYRVMAGVRLSLFVPTRVEMPAPTEEYQ